MVVAPAAVVTRVLIITTSATHLGETDIATGAWLEDVLIPYYYFRRKGFIVDIASVRGGQVPLEQTGNSNQRRRAYTASALHQDRDVQEQLSNTPSIVDVQGADYNAVLIAGGHGIMWDGPFNKELHRIIQGALAEEGVIAALGHGVSALVDVKQVDPRTHEIKSIVAGKQVTAITNEEERAFHCEDKVPFLLETKLREVGAIFQRGQVAGAPFVVRSNNLITGQNSASATALSQQVVDALSLGVLLTP